MRGECKSVCHCSQIIFPFLYLKIIFCMNTWIFFFFFNRGKHEHLTYRWVHGYFGLEFNRKRKWAILKLDWARLYVVWKMWPLLHEIKDRVDFFFIIKSWTESLLKKLRQSSLNVNVDFILLGKEKKKKKNIYIYIYMCVCMYVYTHAHILLH